MTAEELYKLTKSIMFEKATSKDYDNYYLDNINIILSECFNLNNTIRASLGKEPLTTIPKVTQKDSEIPYEEELCREVLPNGLASRFFIDDDLSKFNIFNTYYIVAQQNRQRLMESEIRDIYA